MTIDQSLDVRRRMAAIHAEHSRAVLYFLLGLTGGDQYHAEDMLQETMLRAWRHIDSVPNGRTELRRWLFTVARHVTIDSIRRRQKQPQEVQLTDLAVPATFDETMGTVLAAYSIRQTLHELTSDQRMLLTELYVHGRPVRQVADLLGLPIGTVKSRAHHAVQVFRKAATDMGDPVKSAA